MFHGISKSALLVPSLNMLADIQLSDMDHVKELCISLTLELNLIPVKHLDANLN